MNVRHPKVGWAPPTIGNERHPVSVVGRAHPTVMRRRNTFPRVAHHFSGGFAMIRMAEGFQLGTQFGCPFIVSPTAKAMGHRSSSRS